MNIKIQGGTNIPKRSCIAAPLQFQCASSILVAKFESFPNTNPHQSIPSVACAVKKLV
jgi:hypothetical protein